MEAVNCISKDMSLTIEALNPIIIDKREHCIIVTYDSTSCLETAENIDAISEFYQSEGEELISTETIVDVYELVKDVNYIQLFTSLSSDLDKLVMTQPQIIRFCEKYAIYLACDDKESLLTRDSNVTILLFLTRMLCEYTVVRVTVRKQVLRAYNESIGMIRLLSASEDHNLIVVPRQ